ncbi:CB1 cannabinoid receptor-interacting protein 1b isoform X1 [Scleropages formosus]|uniref:CB1 cannabinoid receptor-interacting protein 1b isoform X1 n=1 Tax=Scleropages formosus TaxID=113540 RepID=UPI0010FA9C51|nr:CB1 cannabinoid receptor-interacting protein 1 isoform X1 [Scleropages formosus]
MGDGVPQLIKISVSLKVQPNNGPVFFKVDGSRFGQNRTIKLLTGSKYRVEVVMKPGAAEATTMSIGGVTFPLEQQSKDPQSVVYTGVYDTEGVTHTKSGERQPVQVNIQVKTSQGACCPETDLGKVGGGALLLPGFGFSSIHGYGHVLHCGVLLIRQMELILSTQNSSHRPVFYPFHSTSHSRDCVFRN